jgi:cell division protein FtsI/penicillin-binding protein 2
MSLSEGYKTKETTAATIAEPVRRVRIWYGVLLCIFALFVVRLFYVQVIRYEHYKNSALSDQLKQYQIPATRGIILAQTGSDTGSASDTVPIVLNQKLYLVYADPLYIKNPAKVATNLAQILGGSASSYKQTLDAALNIKGNRYAVLAKKVDGAQNTQILALKNPGLGTVAQDYRTYPQGDLAAQLLGFVNDAGDGSYGIEQAEDSELKGTSGELKAITDVHGVPLAASSGNISKPAVDGKNVVLTIDLPMQQRLEQILAAGVTSSHAVSGSAVIIDPNTGAVKAMANVPSYDPSKYYDVTDPSLFNNAAVNDPIEIGSTMKVLTTAAALDQGVIKL